ncbi:multi-sensor signal transduction multi-kinase [Nitzschia inconspicua]|uniref:Multi-sensor signal transduction multi-kinase n=1 Tax=Nitzschia inconspicua TaxID=303405 RepID=A0A9K3Q7M5_9STRA|nr:multi-sensor signal transduction multi-kinase [Nitzschia inconspicua]
MANEALSAFVESDFHHSNSQLGYLVDHEENEEIPMKRAVRMVVGLSESSLQSPQDQRDVQGASAIPIELPLKWRQESAASASTSSTERTSFHSQDGATAGDFSESQRSETIDVGNVPLSDSIIENECCNVLLVRDGQNPEQDEDDLSGSGMFSLQKLYGRQYEEETLFDTYSRIVQQTVPRQELEYVLISGGVGTGKTALTYSLSRKVKAEGGFFCVGIFDKLGQRGPVQPLVDSFAQYVQQVFDYGDAEVKMARSRIHSMVDAKDLPSLMRIVPALRKLMGDDHTDNLEYPRQREEGEINDPSQKNYSHFAMMRLMRAISRPQRPVVMMLDNLQWSSECAFEYLKSMVLDDMNDSFMFLGITRNDVAPDASISKFLRDIEDNSVRITNIELENFQSEVVTEIIEDSFVMPEAQSASLAGFMHQVSCGNPFFVASSVKMLQEEPRFLNYDKEANTWSFKPENAEAYVSTCPIDLVTKKLECYPREEQKVLMVVACLGSHSTHNMIEAALQEDAAEPLTKLVEKGKLKFDKVEKTYTFRFNAFEAAAYNLIGHDLKPAFHLEIGLRLMKYLTPEELDDKIFCVGMQLLPGLSLLQDQDKKYEVAALFVRCAQKSAETFSFNASLWALRNAKDLLGPNHWEEAYDLTMAIYNYLAEMEFALADSEHVDELLDEIDEHGRSCEDKRQSYITRIHILGVRGEPDQAIDKGISSLRYMGVNLHTDLRRLNLIWSMSKINRMVRGKSNEMLRRLPVMNDIKQLTAMQVLNLLFLDTFLHRRKLFPFVVLKMMKLSLEFGLSSMSAVAFAGYGTLLAFSGRGEEAQRFGKLALDLVDRFEANSFRSRVFGLVYGCIQPAVQPWRNSLKMLREGHELGLLSGDVEFAMFCGHLHICFMLDDGGFTIKELIDEISRFMNVTEAQGQSQHVDLSSMRPLMNAFEVYNNPTGDLDGSCDFLVDATKEAVAEGHTLNVCLVYYSRIYAHFAMQEYKKALELFTEKNALFPPTEKSIFESFAFYIEGLCVFGCVRQEKSASARKSLMKKGRKIMKKLQKLAVQNPDSCLGKATLLEAECAALSKKESLAKIKYSQAMALSVGHKNYFEIISSKQAAGMHHLYELNDPRTSVQYFEEAIEVSKEFGGHAAVTHWEDFVRGIKERRRFSNFRSGY